MENHDRPHKSLERNKGIFFRLGLVISLMITFFAFEWKTAVPREEIESRDLWENIEEEDMPLTYRKDVVLSKPEALPSSKPAVAVSERVILIPDNRTPDPVPDDPGTVIDIIPIDIPNETDSTDDIPVFSAEISPEFPGGLNALRKYLESSIRYPEAARKQGLSGTVYITFVIDEMGKATRLECKGGADKVFYDEAMRVITNMPKWKPGQMGTKKVKVIMSLPVAFRLM